MGITYKVTIECDECLFNDDYDVDGPVSLMEIESITDGTYRLHEGEILCEGCYDDAIEDEEEEDEEDEEGED